MTRVPLEPATPLRETDIVIDAVRALRDSGLPALPVVDAEGRLTGLFGEREFLQAVFPGYVGELGYAGFVQGMLDDVLEKRAACAAERVSEHMNREHVSVEEDFSDIGVAEVFLHHRVLIVPVERDGRPVGVVMRSAFFARLADRFLERSAQ
jgi:CBS domain-containing protein